VVVLGCGGGGVWVDLCAVLDVGVWMGCV